MAVFWRDDRMLTTSCPECGATARLSPASPEQLSCEYCGHDSATPEALRAGMEEIARIVADVDEGFRKLDDQRRQRLLDASRRGRLARRSVILAALTLAAPAGLLIAFLWVILTHAGGAWLWIATLLTPAMFAFLAGTLLLRTLRQREEALTEACRALPPTAEGGHGACHVCGAPLAVDWDPNVTTRSIESCDYCSADNLIDPEHASELSEARHGDLQDLAARVGREAQALRVRRFASMFGVVALFLLAPCSMPVPLIANVALSEFVAIAPSPEHGYVLWTSKAGHRCVATVSVNPDGQREALGNVSALDERLSAPYDGPTFRAERLVGIPLLVSGPRDEQPRKLHATTATAAFEVLSMNYVLLRLAPGAPGDLTEVGKLCLADPPHDLPVIASDAAVP